MVMTMHKHIIKPINVEILNLFTRVQQFTSTLRIQHNSRILYTNVILLFPLKVIKYLVHII